MAQDPSKKINERSKPPLTPDIIPRHALLDFMMKDHDLLVDPTVEESQKSINRPFRILMIDDDNLDAEIFEQSWDQSKIKMELITLENGTKALQYLRGEGWYSDDQRPDIILLDLNMPKKNGREVLREIKADNKLKTIPVIIFTSSELKGDIAKSYQDGANCYVTKPFGLKGYAKFAKALVNFWLMNSTIQRN